VGAPRIGRASRLIALLCLALAAPARPEAPAAAASAHELAALMVPEELFVAEQLEIVRRIYAEASKTSADAIQFEQQFPGLNAEVGVALEPDIRALAAEQHKAIVAQLASDLAARMQVSEIETLRAYMASAGGRELVRRGYQAFDIGAIVADSAAHGAPSAETIAAANRRARDAAMRSRTGQPQPPAEMLELAQDRAMEASRAYLTPADDEWESRMSMILMGAIEKALAARSQAK
jgi:hypothetical protein